MTNVFLLCASLLAMTHAALAQGPVPLKSTGSVGMQIAEPSDMIIVPGSNDERLYVVSDKGHLAEMSRNGSLIRIEKDLAYDLEGICMIDDDLLVVDERTRRIIRLDPATFKVKQRITIPYSGGRNKGFEAMAWDPQRERLLIITERDPVIIFELTRDLQVVNEHEFDRSIRDISSATWHDGHLWLLSDMDMLVLKCDPQDFSIKERYHVPVINPEGIAFTATGELLILSDDRRRLYTFPFQQHGAQ